MNDTSVTDSRKLLMTLAGLVLIVLAPFLPVLVIILVNANVVWIATAITLFLLSLMALLQSPRLTQTLPISDTGLLIMQYFVLAFASIVAARVVADFAQKSRTFAATIL
jgi:hypothetical protein